MADKKALVDSGATDNFIHPAFAKRLGLTMTPLETPKRIYNIDNTSNKSGSITHSLELKVTTKGVDKVMRFLVTDIGNEDILLGYPWLATFEPKFGVTTRTYRLIFIYLTRCTDTGVMMTHALSFYRPLAPLFLLTHAQLAVVTQSCALLYIAAHCDLLSQ